MQKKIDKEIRIAFNIKTFSKEVVVITDEIQQELKLPFNDENFYQIKTDDKILGYFYYGKAPSQEDYFDYLVIFDKDLIIRKIKVLAYREDYGSEIGSKRWLKQFEELDQNDRIRYQEEIKAISGATISARSMTRAVNDLLEDISVLNDENVIK